MAFDIDGARKAGYNESEIADYLGAESKFDVSGARQSGYSDADIIGHLGAAPTVTTEPTETTDSSGPGAITRGFVSGMMQNNPQAAASAMEGYSELTGWEPLRQSADELRGVAKSPEGYTQKTKGLEDVTGVGSALTYAGERLGEGVASTVPSVLTGAAGATLASRLGGKKVAALGGFAGAAFPSYTLNYGDLYEALKEADVKPKDAAEWAFFGAIPITGFDVASAAPFFSRLTGDARKEVMRTLANRIKEEAIKGTVREAGTEGAQQGIQEGVVSAASDKPLFTAENAKGIVEAMITGGLTGGTIGGATGVIPDRAATGAPGEPSAAAEPEAAPNTATPDGAPQPGTVVGIQTPDGPARVVIDGFQDGYVLYRGEDNQQQAAAVDEFMRDSVEPPVSVDPARGDATTVPQMPAETATSVEDGIAAPESVRQSPAPITETVPVDAYADELSRGDPTAPAGEPVPRQLSFADRFRTADDYTAAALTDIGAIDAAEPAAASERISRATHDELGDWLAGIDSRVDPAIISEASQGTQDGDFTLNTEPQTDAATRPAEAERLPSGVTQQETLAGPETGSPGVGRDAVENKSQAGGVGEGAIVASAAPSSARDAALGTQIADSNGEPLVLYRGTASATDDFSDKHNLGGIFFTTDKDYATSMAKRSGRREGGEPRVGRFFVRVKNLAPRGMDIRVARDSGYDGAVFNLGNKSDEIVVFNQEQILNADESEASSESPTSPTDSMPPTLSSGIDPFRVFSELGRRLRGPTGAHATLQQTAKTAGQVAAPRVPPSPSLANLSFAGRYISLPSGLAARDRVSAEHFTNLQDRQRAKENLDRTGAEVLQPYYKADPESKNRINKILEFARMNGVELRDNGRRLAVRIPDNANLELSRPGELVALSPEETKTFFTVRKYLDGRLMDLGSGMATQFGYTGEFNPQAIQRAIDTATHPSEKRAAEKAAEIFQTIVTEGRRKGYIPLSRYGDWYIKILPKVTATPGEDAMPPRLEDGRFELVETGEPFDFLFTREQKGTPPAVQKRTADLAAKYPPSQYDYSFDTVKPSTIAALDLPLLDQMVMAVGMQDPVLGEALYKEVYQKVLDEKLSGFRKAARNIPGYSTDFERALSIYNRQTGDVIANMQYGKKVEDSFTQTQRHDDKHVRQFWKKHRDHFEGPSQDFSAIRQFGFLNYIWGSPASALVNLSQTPLVTANQLAAWAGPKGYAQANIAALEAATAIRANRNGITVNWDRIGRTPEEKAMIQTLRRDGTLDPSISLDLQGGDITESQRLRPYARKLKRVYDVGASMYNTAEQVNRAAAALAYFRAAQDPAARSLAVKAYERDALFREQVGTAPSPEALARYGVEETQFVGGKLNRQPLQRGVGAVLLQFKTYPVNYIRLMYKNFTRMGPEGKIAGTVMLMSLAAVSGVLGLPFADDIVTLAEAAYKAATGEDPMLERKFRTGMMDWGFSQYGAEMMARGPSRQALGVDLSRRLGMGDIAPDLNFTDMFGPAVGATVGRGVEVTQRLKSDQPAMATAAASQTFLGKGPSDVARSLALGSEGYRTQAGAGKIAPSEITAGEQAAKAIGFTPTRFARRNEAEMNDRRLQLSQNAAAAQFNTNVATQYAFAEKERAAGNEKQAKQFEASAEKMIDRRAAKGLPINNDAISQRVKDILAPVAAAVRKTPKMLREEAIKEVFPRE